MCECFDTSVLFSKSEIETKVMQAIYVSGYWIFHIAISLSNLSQHTCIKSKWKENLFKYILNTWSFILQIIFFCLCNQWVTYHSLVFISPIVFLLWGTDDLEYEKMTSSLREKKWVFEILAKYLSPPRCLWTSKKLK